MSKEFKISPDFGEKKKSNMRSGVHQQGIFSSLGHQGGAFISLIGLNSLYFCYSEYYSCFIPEKK